VVPQAPRVIRGIVASKDHAGKLALMVHRVRRVTWVPKVRRVRKVTKAQWVTEALRVRRVLAARLALRVRRVMSV